MLKTQILKTTDITSNEYKACLNIRKTVFVEEQNVPLSIEIDEFEEGSTHFVVLVDDNPVSTGRYRIKGDFAKVERVATLKDFRGQGISRKLMEFMEADIRHAHPGKELLLNAQISALGFYQSLGFKEFGEMFYDADIEHLAMKKK